MDDFGLPTPVTPPTPQPVPQPETPVIVTPKKKFPLKLVAGALMMMLLIGGAWFGVSEVQRRQTVEQKAWEGSKVPECSDDQQIGANQVVEGCILENVDDSGNHTAVCRLKDCGGDGPRQCPNGQPRVCSDPPQYYCDCNSKAELGKIAQCVDKNWPYKLALNKDGFCSNNQLKFQDCSCGEASPSPTPSPTPTPTPTSTPSPSPVTGLACVDLTKNTPTPKVGDKVTFTCGAGWNNMPNPVAFFRVSTDNGTTFGSALPSGGVPYTTTGFVNYDITIDKTGDWEVQCRVCTDSTATTCTTWGKAAI